MATTLPDLASTFKSYVEKENKLPSNDDGKIIAGAIEKLIKDEALTIKDYDKLIHFIQKEKKDDFLQQLKNEGNRIVEEQLILPNGRMPNVAMLIGFTDAETKEQYTVLIHNSKFRQYATPGGKVDKADMRTPGNIEDAYINGAIRECREEALNIPDEVIKTSHTNIIGPEERENLGIPEADTLYDTRTVTIDLGVQNLETVKGWCKAPDPTKPDVAESFCIKVADLDYNALTPKQGRSGTEYTLTRLDSEGKTEPRVVRTTTLVILNGPVDRPELGFKNTIGRASTASLKRTYAELYAGDNPPCLFSGEPSSPTKRPPIQGSSPRMGNRE